MAKLRSTVRIDASPDEVWTILGDLSATPEWLPGTRAARVDDDIRTCTTADGFEIRERIDGYSPERRAYSFTHLDIPLPVRDSTGSFVVEPDGAGSQVVLESSFAAVDPEQEDELRAMVDGVFEQALASLKRRIEHGTRWDRASGTIAETTREAPVTDPQDTPATLSDDDIETRTVGTAAFAGDDTGDDTGDTSDTSDTGDDSGDTGDDSGDTSDTSDTGDDSGDDS